MNYFMAMFTHKDLGFIVTGTIIIFIIQKQDPTSQVEALKLFGVNILIKRFPKSSRELLGSRKIISKFISDP